MEMTVIYCPKCEGRIEIEADVDLNLIAVDCPNCEMIIETDMWPDNHFPRLDPETKLLFGAIPKPLLDEMIENGLYSEKSERLGEFVKSLCRAGYRHPELGEIVKIYTEVRDRNLELVYTELENEKKS